MGWTTGLDKEGCVRVASGNAKGVVIAQMFPLEGSDRNDAVAFDWDEWDALVQGVEEDRPKREGWP